jgi:hypothetical protein
MRDDPPPFGLAGGFTEAEWHTYKLIALDLTKRYGAELVHLGWRTLDLFGLHPTLPGRRVDHMGLAGFLEGAELIELAPTHVRMRKRTGSVLTFTRIVPPPGAVPAWHFHHPEEDSLAYETSTMLDPEAGIGESLYWLGWHVQEITRPGGVILPAGSFSLRTSRGQEPFDLSKDGAIFDWATSAIGIQYGSGVRGEPIQKIWSSTRSKLPTRPNKDWKAAFWVQAAILIDGELVRAIWETNQFASWQAYRDLMTQLAVEGPKRLPKLPVAAHKDTSPILVPVWEIVRYVDRPACLPENAVPPEPKEKGNGAPHGYREGYRDRARGGGSSWDAPSLPDDDIPF